MAAIADDDTPIQVTNDGQGGDDGPTAATLPIPDDRKVNVCKYVGEPGVDETLKAGKNPIEVSWNALGIDDVTEVFLGATFSDRQGRSVVVAPDATDCAPPAGGGPDVPDVLQVGVTIDDADVCIGDQNTITMHNDSDVAVTFTGILILPDDTTMPLIHVIDANGTGTVAETINTVGDHTIDWTAAADGHTSDSGTLGFTGIDCGTGGEDEDGDDDGGGDNGDDTPLAPPSIATLALTGVEQCSIDLVPSLSFEVDGARLTGTGSAVMDDGGVATATAPLFPGANTIPWPTYADDTIWDVVNVMVTFGDLSRSLTLTYDAITADCTVVLPSDPIDQPGGIDPDVAEDDTERSDTERPDTERPDTRPVPVAEVADDDEVLGVVLDRSLPRTGTSVLTLLGVGLGAMGLGSLLLRRRILAT